VERKWTRWIAIGALAVAPGFTAAQDPTGDVAAVVDKNRERAERTALQIWDFAEVEYKETKPPP
jgi:hypothetical protein